MTLRTDTNVATILYDCCKIDIIGMSATFQAHLLQSIMTPYYIIIANLRQNSFIY